jgi:uncharacterized protein YndB with AHSA1/START domain
VTSRVLVALRIAAAPARVFEAFTAEIGEWWQSSPLFQFTEHRDGRVAIEPRLDGRVVETYADGTEFEIGRIRTWEPPSQLVFSWRTAAFTDDQETEVHVRFEDVGGGTRVVVEHFGWDGIPQEHVSRHGFPLFVFQQRVADRWRDLLGALSHRAGS